MSLDPTTLTKPELLALVAALRAELARLRSDYHALAQELRAAVPGALP